jgi:hypothetical protein
MIDWPAGVNKKVLRQSSWGLPSGVIADQTRSGNYKTRAAHIRKPRSFSVVFHMKEPEYQIFLNWWEYACRRGAVSFAFPRIDAQNGAITEYRFSPDQDIQVSNVSGDILELQMSWETI